MKHILVFAYQISPFAGSEFAVAWDYVKNMSQSNKLTVLYGVSEGWLELGDVKLMQGYLSNHEVKNVEFVPVLPDEKIINKLDKIKKSKNAYYKFYFAYNLYHKLVAKAAKDIIAKEKIDIIHFLGPIGYHEPGYLQELGLPYIWGPIGGLAVASFNLLPGFYTMSSKLVLIAKEFINVFRYTFNKRIRKAFKDTDLLITCHRKNAEILGRITGRTDIQVFPENGISELFPLNDDKFSSQAIECIWVGAMSNHKSLYTLLRALKLVDRDAHLIINVVGQGELLETLKRFAEDNGISHFLRWHGSIPRSDVYELFDRSHLHIITSIKEANTTVIWEAMSKGVPTMSLQHSGMADTINEKNGILIPVRSYKEVYHEMARQLSDLVKNPDRLRTLANGVLETRGQYTWDERRRRWNEFYDMAIEAHNRKQHKK